MKRIGIKRMIRIEIKQLVLAVIWVLMMVTQAGCKGSVLDARPEFVKKSGILSDMKMLTQPKASDGKHMASSTLALSPDGKYLAATAGGMEYLVIWDVPAEKVIRKIPGKSQSYQLTGDRVVFSPDGKYLAAGMFVGRGNPLKNYVQIRSSGDSIDIKNDFEGEKSKGKKALPDPGPVVAIFSIPEFELVQLAGAQLSRSQLFQFSPDGRYLILDGRGGSLAPSPKKMLDLIDTRTWESVRQVNDVPRAVDWEFTSDGKYLVDLYVDRSDFTLQKSQDGSREFKKYYSDLRVWDIETLRLEKTFERFIHGEALVSGGGKGRISFSPTDQNYTITFIKRRHTAEGKVVNDSAYMLSVDFWSENISRTEVITPYPVAGFRRYTPDGRYYICMGRNYRIKKDLIQIYTKDGKELEQVSLPVTPFAYNGTLSANGKVLAYSWAHRIFLWRINSIEVEEN